MRLLPHEQEAIIDAISIVNALETCDWLDIGTKPNTVKTLKAMLGSTKPVVEQPKDYYDMKDEK